MKIIAFILIVQSIAFSATYNATTCGTTDVAAAISTASTGDTVTIPAGSCTWTSGVTIATGKGITVTGAGSGRIVAASSTTLTLGTGSKTLTVVGTDVSSTFAIANGTVVRISELGFRANYMDGTVTSYSGGSLVVNATSSSGSCSGGVSNCKRWLVSTASTTIITNNSSGTLFSITENTSVSTNVSGIKFAQGSGGGDTLAFNAVSGGKAILLHDCWIEQGDGDAIQVDTNKGVVWNVSFDSSPFSMAPLGIHHQADSANATSWTTASTMGTDDTTGQLNIYFENCDFHAYLNATDVDNNGRAVFRYSMFNNAGFGTHGADTSNYGNRHFQYYGNIGRFDGYSDGKTFPMNWWFYFRGGTYVITNNVLPQIDSTDYPSKPDVNATVMNLQRSAGPNPCWGQGTSSAARYHSPRQIGFGWVTGAGADGLGRSTDSITYVGDSEPAYSWGNKRTSGGADTALNIGKSDFGECSSPDNTANYFVSDRDYFNTTGTAKPGWTAYTYPHPLRGGGDSTSRGGSGSFRFSGNGKIQ